jgi:hypothetical protein
MWCTRRDYKILKKELMLLVNAQLYWQLCDGVGTAIEFNLLCKQFDCSYLIIHSMDLQKSVY